MKKTLLLLSLVVLSLLNYSQTTVSQIVTPTDLITCGGSDTISVIINSVNGETNLRLETSMSSGYSYGQLISNSNHTEFDISNNQAPVLQIASIASGMADTIQFLVQATCGASTNSLSCQLYDNSGVAIGAPTNSNLININTPLVTLTGTSNTSVANQTGVDLNAVALLEKYTRSFEISYDASLGYLDTVIVCVPLNYHNLIGTSSGAVTYSTSGDTAFYIFSPSDFGGSLSATNNSFIFSDTVEISYCPTNGSMTTVLSAKWGCQNQSCNQDIEVANAIAASGTPDIAVTLAGSGYISAATNLETAGNFSFCGEENYIIATIKNNASTGAENGAYNLDIFYHPRSPWGSNFYGGEGFVFDSIYINNIKVPATVLPSGQPFVESLTTSQYNNGGLIDFDGDGFVDDLMPDSSITVKLYFKYVPDVLNCNANPRLPGLRLNGYRSHFDNMCNINQPFKEDQGYYTYLTRGTGTPTEKIVAPASVQNNTPFTVSLQDSYQRSRQQLSKFTYKKQFIVSKGITIASPKNITWSRVDGNATVYDILKPGAIYDTIEIWTNFMPHPTLEVLSIDLVNNCSANLNACGNLKIIGKTSLSYQDDLGVTCYTTPLVCDSIEISRDCGTIYKGVNIKNPYMHRATFGWTDSSMATKVNKNTSGVILDVAHNYDSIEIGSTIFIDDTSFSDLKSQIELVYSGGSNAVTEISGAGYVEVFHTGIGISFKYELPMPTTNYTGTRKIFTYDLNSFIDSIRFVTGDPTFIYGGNTGNNSFRNDSIKIVMFAYSNRTTGEFNFQSLHTGFSNNLDPNNLCNPAKTTSIKIIKNTISFSSTLQVKGSGCADQLLYGGNRRSSSVSEPGVNHFGLEFKPTTMIDSLYLEWDQLKVNNSPTNTSVHYANRYYTVGTDPILNPSRYTKNQTNVMIRLDSIPQYVNGIPVDVSGASWLMPSCDMSSNARYYVTFHYRSYILGVNGPIVASPRYSLTYNTPYTSPLMTLTPTPPVVEPISDTVCWEVRLNNGTPLYESFNNWMDIRSPNRNINIFNLIDITGGGNDTISLDQYFNGSWAKLDTILGGETKIYKICATFNGGCDYDSIEVRTSFNCSKYPINPILGYPENNYMCNDNVNSEYLYLNNRLAFMESPILSESSTPINYCDTIDYQVKVRNGGQGSAKDLKFRTILPASNLTYVLGSGSFEYPDSSGIFYPLPTPTYTGNYFEWDLTSYMLNDGLLKNISFPDTNAGVISFKMISGCPFTSGDQVQFQAIANHLCGFEANSIAQASSPISLNGLPATPNTYLSVDYNTSVFNSCKENATLSVTVKADSGNISNGNNYIFINLPDSNLNVIGNISNVVNSSYLVSNTPSNIVINGNRKLGWNIAAGMPIGDSIAFEIPIGVTGLSLDCSIINSNSTVVERYSLTCASDGILCNEIYSIIDIDSSNIIIEKSTLDFDNVTANIDLCSDELKVNFNVINNGTNILASQGNFKVILDTNYNNIADSFEPFFLISLADSLNNLDTANIQLAIANYSALNYGDACHLFIQVDTSNSCVCSFNENDTHVDLKLNYTDTVYTCNYITTLTNCNSINPPNLTFQWNDMSNSSFYNNMLSNLNSQNPTFTYSNNTNNLFYRSYVLTANRGNCIDIIDTVTVGIVPKPTIDTTIIKVKRIGIADTAFVDTQQLFFPTTNVSTCSGLQQSNQGNLVTINNQYALLNIWNIATFTSDTLCLVITDSSGCTDTNIFVYLIESKKDTLYVNIDPSVDTTADTCVTSSELFGNLKTFNNTVAYNIQNWNFPTYGGINCGYWTYDNNQLFSDPDPNCNTLNTANDLANEMNNDDVNGNTWTVIGDSIVGNIINGDPNEYGWLCTDDDCGRPITILGTDFIQTCDGNNLTYNSDSLLINGLCISLNVDTNFIGDTACLVMCDDLGFCDTTTIIYGIVDPNPPYLACIDTTLYLGNSTLTIDTSYVLDSIYDLYLNAVWLSNNTFDCNDIGTNQIIIYANDLNGNLDSCIANVTVIDTVKPTITCNDTTIYLSNTGSFTIDTSFVFNTANDYCNLDSIWINSTDITYNCLTNNKTISVYARDISGNIDSCSANITVIDSISPVAICKDTTIYLDASGNATIDSSFINDGSFDNCDASISISTNSFTCNNIGNNTVKLVITDTYGNIDSCFASVLVLDTLKPSVTCNNITIQLDGNGNASITETDIDAGSNDNCSILNTSISKSIFTCADKGVNNVTLTVTDPSGNLDSCSAVVTVEDNTNPIVSCPQNITDTISGVCQFIIPDYTSTMSQNDNCDSATIVISQNPLAGSVIDASSGTANTTITITATDLSSNSYLCSFTVDLTCTNEIEIPQFISPNGDGKNDFWVIPEILNYADNNVKVFNRFGNLVFEAKNYQNNWGGKASINKGINALVKGGNENILPEGTYFYIVDLNNEQKPYSGYINIIR